jgi:hypothetical protein
MAITFDLTKVEPDPQALREASLADGLGVRGVREIVVADSGGARLVEALPLKRLRCAALRANARYDARMARPIAMKVQ